MDLPRFESSGGSKAAAATSGGTIATTGNGGHGAIASTDRRQPSRLALFSIPDFDPPAILQIRLSDVPFSNSERANCQSTGEDFSNLDMVDTFDVADRKNSMDDPRCGKRYPEPVSLADTPAGHAAFSVLSGGTGEGSGWM